MVNYLTQHGFIRCTSDFSYLCKTQTPCTYVWRHKDVKAQRVDHATTLLPRLKNLTHTSKTRQVKRIQMVATGRFTIRAFVTFSNC